MIGTKTTSRSTFPQDSSAQRTRDLSALLDQIAAEPAPIRSGALIGIVIKAWQAGFVAARETPVCDFCGESVVSKCEPAVNMSRPMWAHQATGLYGCDRAPYNTFAQVNGGSTPAQTDAKAALR